MSNEAACAHLHVEYQRAGDVNGWTDHWFCRDCRTEFAPFIRSLADEKARADAAELREEVALGVCMEIQRIRAEKAEAALAEARGEYETALAAARREVVAPEPPCPTCGGTGRVRMAHGGMFKRSPLVLSDAPCPDCEGPPRPPPPIPSKVAVSSWACKGCFYEPDNGHCPSHPRPDWSCWTKVPD